MALPVDVLAHQVLQLPATERAKLLNRVIDSLETDARRDARRNAVAARRGAEAEANPSVLLPAGEALARLRAATA